ncbi:MAG: hypothetical protein Q9173_001838 [Seirophora scorigena]
MDADVPVPIRKSGRKLQPKKFGRDEITNLDLLNSASEGEIEAWEHPVGSSSDEEFRFEQAVRESDDPEENVVPSVGAASDRTGIATPAEDSNDDASYASAYATRPREDADLLMGPRLKDFSHIYTKRRRLEAGTHIRGITDPLGASAKGAKGEYLTSLFGPATQDLIHAARSRDQWSEDVALPRRANGSGTRGMRHLFSQTAEKRQVEATEGWNWYFSHGGRQRFEGMQKSQLLSSEQGMTYIPKPSQTQRTIFMGPYGSQSRFVLPALQSMSIGEAWGGAPQHGGSEEPKPQPPRSQRQKEGWLLHVGTGVRCLEWAPNRAAGTQYLAISTVQPRENGKIGHLKFSPAFTAQSFPSSIQIWSFPTSKRQVHETLLDADNPPCLKMVICTNWGDPKHLRWCPMPIVPEECDQEEARRSTGLLAGVWSDGHVRVLDIQLKQLAGMQDTQYLRYTSAAFTAKPPSTLCTSVTWLSPTELAVGCANGHLAIWSIYPPPSSFPQTCCPTPSTSSAPSPRLYYPLHPSYILSLSTAYPLAPHLLATSSAAGHLRLTSLRSPHTDYVLSPRMRHVPSQVHFSEPCHAFLTADDNDSVKVWPLRRFFSPVNVARIPSAGLCLATGNFHASALAGCADGSVCAVNPIRKMLYPKMMSWQLPVLKHEFRRATEEEREMGDDAGKVRITEGFKLKEANMVQGTKGGTGKAVEGVVVATIWEEEGQVRAVAWGSSVEVGGWVAVGFGSGLVRVEDLAI